jgi:hypothetical protein
VVYDASLMQALWTPRCPQVSENLKEVPAFFKLNIVDSTAIQKGISLGCTRLFSFQYLWKA